MFMPRAMGYFTVMLATVTSHDLLLILAIVLFFVAAAVYGFARSLAACLTCIGLGVFAWSFLVVL